MAIKVEPNAEPLPGYRLIERLGGGGFGEVWKAEAPGGLFKAIKFVHGDMDSTDEEGARAEQELKSLRRICGVRHAYILSLDRFDIIDGQLLIVMVLADRTLWDRFKECRSQGLLGIPRKELVGYMKETAEALDFMYDQFQLLHLDIKPQNLFLVHNHVNVADFGLTKNMQGTAASITGGVTPVYAAPETFDGEGRRSTDQYSLGIVYQELLTGQRPFSGTTARQLVLQHLQAEPDLSQLPTADQAIVRKALSKNYRDRFETCSAFVAALEEVGLEKPPTLFVTSPSSPQLPSPSAPTNGFPTVTAGEPPPSTGSLGTRPKRQRDSFPGGPSKTGHLFERVNVPEPEDLPQGAPSAPEPPAWERGGKRNAETPSGIQTTEPGTWTEQGKAHVVQSGSATALPPHRAAPVQPSGDGVLVPALVIGVGFLGQLTLKQLRHQIQEHFGTSDYLPHIRSLYLDTDPRDLSLATRGGQAALHMNETVLTRLHRANHYLKLKEGASPYQSWFPSKMLYRIPRNQIPSGVRALGRLAFVDNYEYILARLDAELRMCFAEEALSTANQKTGLGIYSGSPRVYLVTSLAGGTGSGMFIDLGYAVRGLLKEFGVENPDVVGVLLLPYAGNKKTVSPGLANTFASLTELEHFSQPQAIFSADYGSKNGSRTNGFFSAKEPPFRRCILVPTDEDWRLNPDDQAEGNLASPASAVNAANLLFVELCTRLGREADQERQRWGDLHKNRQWAGREQMICQTTELVRFDWPFKQIRRRTANRLCQGLVQHWINKNAKPIRESIQQWVHQQWAEMNLGPTPLIERLKEFCQTSLGKEPESLITELIYPLAELIKTPVKNSRGGKNGRDGDDQIIPLGKVVELLEEFEVYLGSPDGCQQGTGSKSSFTAGSGKITEILAKGTEELAREYEVKIAELVVRLIEQPEFRLAGAEETLRQFSVILQRTLENQEDLNKEIHEKSVTLYQRIHTMLENPDKHTEKETGWLGFSRRTASRQSQYAKDLLELLRAYGKYRFQSMVLHAVGGFFVSLRGQMSDQLREVDFCRARLSELANKLAELQKAETRSVEIGGKKQSINLLLPEGCRTVDNAVDIFTNRITPEEFNQLDHQVEQMMRKQFRALVHICMGSSTSLRNLIPKMLEETEKFLDGRLESTDVVRMYLQKHGGDTSPAEAEKAISASLLKAYEDAEPEMLGPTDEDSICIVGSPDSPEGEEFRRLARQALPRTRVQFSSCVDEIILYREQLHTSLGNLKQLGQTTKNAYQQVAHHETLTPHSRLDITHWSGSNS